MAEGCDGNAARGRVVCGRRIGWIEWRIVAFLIERCCGERHEIRNTGRSEPSAASEAVSPAVRTSGFGGAAGLWTFCLGLAGGLD